MTTHTSCAIRLSHVYNVSYLQHHYHTTRCWRFDRRGAESIKFLMLTSTLLARLTLALALLVKTRTNRGGDPYIRLLRIGYKAEILQQSLRTSEYNIRIGLRAAESCSARKGVSFD